MTTCSENGKNGYTHSVKVSFSKIIHEEMNDGTARCKVSAIEMLNTCCKLAENGGGAAAISGKTFGEISCKTTM